jgi:DNA polymerase-3 subunit delta'
VPGFESIIDQDLPVRVLKTFLKNGTFPHALLFTGIQGVGRESAALTFAMGCNCEGGGFNSSRPESEIPCGLCKPCRKIQAGNHPDIIRVKPSGPFIKIDQIRALCQVLAMKPYEARNRVVIVTDAQTMNPAAGNAFLKMLEEPPLKTLLILVATQPSDLLPTIVSRCQQLRFKPISSKRLQSVLVDGHGFDPGDAAVIATMAGGSLTRALRMHQTHWVSRRNWIIKEMQAFTSVPINRLLAFSEQLARNKEALQDSLEVMKTWLRDLVVGQINPGHIINQDLVPEIRQVSKKTSIPVVLDRIDTIQATQNAIQTGTNLRLAIEAMVLKLAKA